MGEGVAAGRQAEPFPWWQKALVAVAAAALFLGAAVLTPVGGWQRGEPEVNAGAAAAQAYSPYRCAQAPAPVPFWWLDFPYQSFWRLDRPGTRDWVAWAAWGCREAPPAAARPAPPVTPPVTPPLAAAPPGPAPPGPQPGMGPDTPHRQPGGHGPIQVTWPAELPPPPAPAPKPEPPAPAPTPEPPAPKPEAPAPAPKPEAPAPAPKPEPPAPRPEAPAPAPTPEAPAPAPTPEAEMLALVNAERARAGLPPLAPDARLGELARLKSQDMIDNGYFGHQSPTYGSPFDLLKQFGVTYKTAAENLAGNATVAGAHQTLMASSGHRRNLLNPAFTRVGLGIVPGGPYGLMITQLFTG